MEYPKLTFVAETSKAYQYAFLGDNKKDYIAFKGRDDDQLPEDIARRIVASWNYCHGVPTAELESKGADAGFWGRACSNLETKNEKLQAQNADLLAAVKEMERMLPVVEYLQISRLWETANEGENASLENYRSTLKKALEAVKNQTT